MKSTKIGLLLILVTGLSFFVPASPRKENCTSAVISPQAAAESVPILWKNRDTGVLSNKVVYVKETPFSYLALVNAVDPSGRKCYAGLNSAGFAVMNTVAYNLPQRSGEMKDLEGIIMADALRICRTVEDFETYIHSNLGPDLGSLANFGVIDSSGKAFLFEIHNHGYHKFNAASTPEKYIVNTNFARTGEEERGEGYLRFERASELFQGFRGMRIAFQDILSHFSRDLGHVLLEHPSLRELKGAPAEENLWISTRDCINKSYTSAAVVIVGKNPHLEQSLATMWVIPGEPVCAIAVPLWVEAESSPESMWKGKEAPMWRESLRIKKIIRPNAEGHKEEYINLTRLDNAEGTGFLSKILTVEKDIVSQTLQFLKKKHSPSELADFQERMAEKALSTLKSIQ